MGVCVCGGRTRLLSRCVCSRGSCTHTHPPTHPPTHTHTHTHTHTERTRCRASGNTRSTCRAGAAWTKGNARAKGFPRDAWGAWPSWEAGSLWYSGETWSTRPPWKEKVRAGVARGEGFYGRLSSTGTTMGGVLFHWSCASCRLPASTIKHIRSLQIHLPVCFMMTWRIKSLRECGPTTREGARLHIVGGELRSHHLAGAVGVEVIRHVVALRLHVSAHLVEGGG